MGKSLDRWRIAFDYYKDERNELTREGLALLVTDYRYALLNHEYLQAFASSCIPFRASFDEFLALVRGNSVKWVEDHNTSEQLSDQVLFSDLAPSDRLSLELGFQIEAEIFHSRARLKEIEDTHALERPCEISFV